MSQHSFARYLSSKKTVDDRALNKDVIARLRTEMARPGDHSLEVLDLGAGLGTMLPRLVDWGVLRRARYTLLDVDGALLRAAQAELWRWATGRGHTVTDGDVGLAISGESGVDILVDTVQRDVHDALATDLARGPSDGDVDLVVACAFWDLVDVGAALPRVLSVLRPSGLFYFPIHFDGVTIFEPPHPADDVLLGRYHRTMDERVRGGRPSGDSRTGRHFFGHLRRAGAVLLAAGASDWVVHPVEPELPVSRAGSTGDKYPADEAYFLEHIIHTIDVELRQHADVEAAVLAGWVHTRRGQLARGELVLIAHQLDFLGRVTG